MTVKYTDIVTVDIPVRYTVKSVVIVTVNIPFRDTSKMTDRLTVIVTVNFPARDTVKVTVKSTVIVTLNEVQLKKIFSVKFVIFTAKVGSFDPQIRDIHLPRVLCYSVSPVQLGLNFVNIGTLGTLF